MSTSNATAHARPHAEKLTQAQVDEQLSELKEHIAERGRVLADARNANAMLTQEVKLLNQKLEDKAKSIESMKRIIFDKDIYIATLQGRISGKAEEQKRVYELENPLIQVNRKNLNESPGLMGVDTASRYPDYLSY